MLEEDLRVQVAYSLVADLKTTLCRYFLSIQELVSRLGGLNPEVVDHSVVLTVEVADFVLELRQKQKLEKMRFGPCVPQRMRAVVPEFRAQRRVHVWDYSDCCRYSCW